MMATRPLIQIRVIQFDGAAVPDMQFSFRPALETEYRLLEGTYESSSGVYTFLLDDYKPGLYMLRVEAAGYPLIEKKAEFRDAGYSGEIFLVDDETECVKMGGRRVYFRRRPRVLGVYVTGNDFEEARERLRNSTLLNSYLINDLQNRLVFEAPLPIAGEESEINLRELLRVELGNFEITDQAIETKGGLIEFLSRRINIELEPGAQWEDVRQELVLENIRVLYQEPNAPSLYVLEVESAEAYTVLDFVYELLRSPMVKTSEPECRALTTTTSEVLPGDLLRPWQWHHKVLRTPEAWSALKTSKGADLTFGSADLILAIHDSGIEAPSSGVNHPDLQGNVTGGILTSYLNGNGAKVYYQYDFSFSLNPFRMMELGNVHFRPSHHGIGVAGLAVASSDGTTGIVGIAPNVRLATYIHHEFENNTRWSHSFQFIAGFEPLWALQEGGMYLEGQEFPIAFGTGDNPGPGADIINCSHTKKTAATSILQDGLRRITLLGRNRRGVIMLVSATNSDSDALSNNLSRWGNFLNLLKISASTVNSNGQEVLAAYSSHSTFIDPGLDVCVPSNSNWPSINNPPDFYGVVTHEKVGAGNIAGTNVTQAIIQSNPAEGATSLVLLASDFPNYDYQNGPNVIICGPVNNELIETNDLVAPPVAAPPNTIYLSSALDTDFPEDSRIIRGANDYTEKFSGTSAAAPMVSGVVALMLSAKPSLTWAEVRQILRDTSVPIALRYLGPNGSCDKRWVNAANEAVIDTDGLMHVPAGAPRRTITTELKKGASFINVADASDFSPRQAICIGAESKLSAPTTPGSNQITVEHGDDFELNDIIYIGKLHETLIDKAAPSTPANVSFPIRVADPDGFVVGDVLDVGGQLVNLEDVSYLQGMAETDARVTFSVETIGPFVAVPLGTKVRIGATQREHPFKIIAKTDNLLTLNRNVPNVHPVGRIVQKENTEIAAVKRVVSPNQIEVYPLINDHEPVENSPIKLHINGGRIAFYSHGFGYGRVDAFEAVNAAIYYSHNDRDLMIRNFMGDDGVTNRASQPVHSPDLWVTNDTPTPSPINYTLPGPHQNPRMSISAPVFVGSGLNDLSAEGSFSGASDTNYIIEITTASATDQFTWRKQGGVASAPIAITGAFQNIDLGVSVKFGAVTGHAVGDKWYIRCENITARHVHLRLRNRGTDSTFAASAYTDGLTTPVNQYRIFLCLSDGTPVVQYRPAGAAGLNDLTVVSHYVGTKDIITIKIETFVGPRDSFKWSKGSGAFSLAIDITGEEQVIGDGVIIKFGAIAGHAPDDRWVLKCYPDKQKFVNIDHFILSNPTTPFSLTTNRPGTWMMDEQGFPVMAGGEDKYFSYPWPESNVPPRNGFGVAKPALPQRMFIMGEVIPHDGKLIGDIAEEDNNFSYREIIFARFGFKSSNLVEELATYVEVDSFGAVAHEDFSVQVITDVSSFDADAVKLEFVTVRDNSTTESKVFEFDGSTWGFAGGDPDWCTMDGSPMQADGTTVATDEQYHITFSGVLHVNSQLKNIKITPKIYSTVNKIVVLAEESRTVVVMQRAQLASGRYSGNSPTDVIPRSHFFADHLTNHNGVSAQVESIAYGPLSGGSSEDKENKFRVTSLFKAATNVKAYAIVDGIVMLQRVADKANPGSFLANVVNLVIRPYKQAMNGFTPVKYFVYRNLLLADFLKGDSVAEEKLVREKTNASPFIQGLWDIHMALNGSEPFESLMLGFDPDHQPSRDKIDKLFYRQDPLKQLPFVGRGVHIGNFFANSGGDEFGIEIILDDGEFQPDFDYVRKYKEVIIDVSEMPADTDAKKFAVRLEREKILNYIDPAAFFGMHMSKGGWVQVVDDAGNQDKLSGVEIYDQVIEKFYTRNTLYLDVRNENGHSLNFYGAYNDGSGNALEVGDTPNSLTAQSYASDKWPLIIRPSASAASSSDKNLVFVRLRRDYNKKPILYLEHAESTSKVKTLPFIADDNLILPSDTTTNALGFRFPNKEIDTSNRIGIAWMLKMHYSMRIEPTNVPFPDGVVPTATYLDNLFGPVDIDPLWKARDPVLVWRSAQNKKYVDGHDIPGLGFEYVADRGVAFSLWTESPTPATRANGTVLFYAGAKDCFEKGDKKFVPHDGITGGVSSRSSFFDEPMLFGDYTVAFNVVVDGSDEVPTMNLQEVPPSPRPAWAMLVLGLARAEFDDSLKSLTGFDPRYPRTILLEELAGSPFTDVNGESYRKYKAGLRGMNDNGKAQQAFPATDLTVYTTDQKFFFSKAFTQLQPLPTAYLRNYEEAFGLLDRAGKTYLISAIAGTSITFDDTDLSREIVPSDKVDIKGTDYSVSSVTFGGADTVIDLTTAPSGITPGTDSVRGPTKKLEDYYIAKDSVSLSSDLMKTLVDEFVTGVNNTPDNAAAPAAIQSLVNNYGPRILQRARLICSNDNASYADDRILYWARIKMLSNMKNHPYLRRVITQRNRLEKLFETKSRGYDAVTFTAAANRKNVLITGFDPFQIALNNRRSNPSGAAVLSLHGKELTAGSQTIHIETAIFPVRYADFDQNPAPDVGTGVVESFFKQFIVPGTGVLPDMILTLSQGGVFQFWLERFASRTRGGGLDNMNIGKLPFPKTVPGDQFYETTLPEQKIVPDGNTAGVFKVYYNNIFVYTWENRGHVETSGYYVDPRKKEEHADNTKLKIENGHPHHNRLFGLVPSELTDFTLPKKSEITAVLGSGGDYLSNEIFYRVSRLRKMQNPTMMTGHYHLPLIQHHTGESPTPSKVNSAVKTTEDFSPDLVSKLIEEIRKSLVRAFS